MDERTWQRATACNSSACVEVQFRAASDCGSATCVEVGTDGDAVFVRDSKDLGIEPLRFSAEAWADFVAGVQAGEFDG